MTDVPELRTERLLLRGWRADDYEPFGGIVGDAEVAAALGVTAPLPVHEAWNDVARLAGHWALKGFGHWVLELPGSGEVIGRAGLYLPPDWPEIEVGWTVARKHWGNGYAPEAARAACEWGRAELGLRHVVSLILPSNAPSIRVAQKLGERPEGWHTARGFRFRVYGTKLPLGSPP